MDQMVDARSSNCLVPADQGSLEKLAAQVREAHAGVISAFANAIEKAIEAGRALNLADDLKLVAHGHKGRFYKLCGLGDRQAERYKKLARLANANSTLKSEMTGLSIEEAIKKLSPPSPSGRSAGGKQNIRQIERPAADPTPTKATHVEITAAWLPAPAEERTKFLHAIGRSQLRAALPAEWLPLLKHDIAECEEVSALPTAAVAPADLSIPECLRRTPEGNSAALINDDHGAGAAEDFGEEDEYEDDEPAQKPRRKLKVIEHEYTVAEAIDFALTDLEGLASECREKVENAPESLQYSERIVALSASADALEDVERPEFADALGIIPVKCALPKRRYLSRAARASDASSLLEACVKALNGISDGGAETLINELESVIDVIDGCEFPGMYG
jgi:hypothetical protein